jgi:uncharacterized protein YciI
LKLNSREATNDLLLVQNDLAALGLRTNDDRQRKNIIKAHGDYLQSLTEIGSIVCHGPVDDPKGGWGLSIFSAKEVERLTAADPIILDDVGARYEILPMKQLRMKGAS